MDIIWKEEDIKAGITVSKTIEGEKFIMGYTVWHGQQISPRSNHCLISLTDGMVLKPGTAKEITELLNKGNYIPTVLFDLYKGVK